jgi:hypothetical protein
MQPISLFSDEFWNKVGRERVHWREPFQTVSDCDLSKGKVSWFLGGKLNVSGVHRYFGSVDI